MLKTKQKYLILAAVVVAAGAGYVVTKKVITSGDLKEYTLSNVALVVSNGEKCNAVLQSLDALAKEPIKLEFSNKEGESQITVKDSAETLKNHTHSITKQKVADTVYRVGNGEFDLNNEKVDYVVVTSADVKNEKYNHAYPVIISSDQARCHFTALLKPSADTATSFIKSIHSEDTEKKSDLTTK